MTDALTRSSLAKIALAAWVNVEPDKLPADKMWIEHPNDANRQSWDRVVEALAVALKDGTAEPLPRSGRNNPTLSPEAEKGS